MTTVLDLFPQRIRFVDEQGRLTPEGFRALAGLFQRVGGATGASTTDLSISDDEDSGLEEFKSETWKSLTGLGVGPAPVFLDAADWLTPPPQEFISVEYLETQIASLREEVAALRTEIAALQQGTTI